MNGASAVARHPQTRKAAEHILKSPQRGFKTIPKEAKIPDAKAPDMEFGHHSRFDCGSTPAPNSPCMPRSSTPRRGSDKEYMPAFRRGSEDPVRKNLFETEYMKAFDNAVSEMAEGIPVARMIPPSFGESFAASNTARSLFGAFNRASTDSPATVMKGQASSLHTSAAQESAALLESGSFGFVPAALRNPTSKAVVTKALENSPLRGATAKMIEESRALLGAEPSSIQALKAILFGSEVLLPVSAKLSLDIGAHNVLVKGNGPIAAILKAVKQARGGSDDVTITVIQKESLIKLVSVAGSATADGFSALAKLVGAVLFTTAIAEGKQDTPSTEVRIERDDDAKSITITEEPDGVTVVRASSDALRALVDAAVARCESDVKPGDNEPDPEDSVDVPVTTTIAEDTKHEDAATVGEVPHWIQCAGI